MAPIFKTFLANLQSVCLAHSLVVQMFFGIFFSKIFMKFLAKLRGFFAHWLKGLKLRGLVAVMFFSTFFSMTFVILLAKRLRICAVHIWMKNGNRPHQSHCNLRRYILLHDVRDTPGKTSKNLRCAHMNEKWKSASSKSSCSSVVYSSPRRWR